jgi:CYTH domain-containing protein
VLIEIERKFLLAASESLRHPILDAAERVSLEQIYLGVSAHAEERIRRRSGNDTIRYAHTILRPLRAGVREIEEVEITADQYEKLRERQDPDRRPVTKDRWFFTWREQLFELDDIRQPASRACRILEIQLDDERDEVILPDFLRIDREVTGVAQYSNADIARG